MANIRYPTLFNSLFEGIVDNIKYRSIFKLINKLIMKRISALVQQLYLLLREKIRGEKDFKRFLNFIAS